MQELSKLLSPLTRSALDLDRDDAQPPSRAPGRPAAAPTTIPTALPAALRTELEHAFGASFAAVRVHVDGEAARHGARAFAQGTELHFAPGAYDPDTAEGRALIGHELAHVVQQAEGRGQADAALEHEADDHGARATRGERVRPAGAAVVAPEPTATGPIQRQKSLVRDQHVIASGRRGIVCTPIGAAGHETHYDVLMFDVATVERHTEPHVALDPGSSDPTTVDQITQFFRKTGVNYVPDHGQLFTWQTFGMPEPVIPAVIANSPYVMHYLAELPEARQRAATKLPKPEPRPKPKSEAKPEPKSEAKPEPKSEAKPEPKSEPKSEPKPEAKPEPRPEPKLSGPAQSVPTPPGALHDAVRGNQPVALLRLLGASDLKIDELDDHGDTALHVAVRERRRELARRLLDARASTRIANAAGDTPLHLAVAQNDEPLVALLLGYGADPKARDHDKLTAHQLATRSGHAKLLPLLTTEAEDFEVALGKHLFRDPSIERGTQELIDKLDKVLAYTATGGLQQPDGSPVDPGVIDHVRARRLGTDDKTKSGAVGTKPDDVRLSTVGGGGNVRTHMTALNMYTRTGALDLLQLSAERTDLMAQETALEDHDAKPSGTDVKVLVDAVWKDHDTVIHPVEAPRPGHGNPADVHRRAPRMQVDQVHGAPLAQKKQLAKAAAVEAVARKLDRVNALKLDWQMLARRVPAKLPPERDRVHENTTVIAHSAHEPIASQDGARKLRGGASSSSARTFDDVYETAPSWFELEFMAGALKIEIADTLEHLLPWIEGGSLFTVDEAHPWVAKILQRGIPLLAGPSGTSEKLLQLAELFQFDTKKMALACLAWMLPGSGNDHSFFEIMAVVADHVPTLSKDRPEDSDKTDIDYTKGLGALMPQNQLDATKRMTAPDGKRFPAYSKRKGALPEADGIGRAQSLKLRAANQTYQIWMEIGGTPAVCIHSFDGDGELDPAALLKELGTVHGADRDGVEDAVRTLASGVEDARAAATGIDALDGDAQLQQLDTISGHLRKLPPLVGKILGGLVDDADDGMLDLYKGVQLAKTLEDKDYLEKRDRQKPGMATQSPAVRERIEQLVKDGQLPEHAADQATQEVSAMMAQMASSQPETYRGVTYLNQLDAMLSLYVKNLKVLKSDLRTEDSQSRDVPWSQDKAHLAGVPQMSTTKNPRQAVFYAVGEKKPEHKRRTEGVIGQIYIYAIPRGAMKHDFEQRRAVDILASNQANKSRGYKQDAHKLTESEVTFMTEIPGDYLVQVMNIAAGEDYTGISERAKQCARAHAEKGGGLKRWPHLG